MESTTKVLADGFGFLEGPRWHDGALWMADMGRGAVVRLAADGSWRDIVQISGKIAGLGFLADGAVLFVAMEERLVYRAEGGELTVHADLTAASDRMLNDMVVDAQGRAYVGNSGYNPFLGEKWAGDNTGSILLVAGDGGYREVAADLAFPNGALITADNRLVVAESRLQRLTSFEILPDGSLGSRRIEAELPGDPDGICLDAEGAIWAGLGKTEQFVRVKAGRVVQTVATPGRKATACQLGGRDGRTLYCLTGKFDTVAQIGQEPLSRVEAIEVEIPAAGSP